MGIPVVLQILFEAVTGLLYAAVQKPLPRDGEKLFPPVFLFLEAASGTVDLVLQVAALFE